MKTLPALAALTLISQVSAHYYFNQLLIDGVLQPAEKYIRHFHYETYLQIMPIEDIYDPAIRCNNHSTPAPDVATVPAGTSVGFKVRDSIGHPGPFTAYLAKAPIDITTWDESEAEWFKIWELGEIGPRGHTAYNQLQWSGYPYGSPDDRWNFTIPAATPSGQYLLRFEHIGLHQANAYPGAQHFISCAQVEVVDGGDGTPGPTVKFPGAYSGHEGLIVDIWGEGGVNLSEPLKSTPYKVPGPAVWRG